MIPKTIIKSLIEVGDRLGKLSWRRNVHYIEPEEIYREIIVRSLGMINRRSVMEKQPPAKAHFRTN